MFLCREGYGFGLASGDKKRHELECYLCLLQDLNPTFVVRLAESFAGAHRGVLIENSQSTWLALPFRPDWWWRSRAWPFVKMVRG